MMPRLPALLRVDIGKGGKKGLGIGMQGLCLQVPSEPLLHDLT
jgi:hypothetical protein